MKTAYRVSLAILILAAAALAQSNPVTEAARNIYQRQAKAVTAAAESMPAEDYSFKPTPDQRSFGATVLHVAEDNGFRCARLNGDQPAKLAVTEADGKDKIVQALKDSFSACDAALQKVQDAGLSAEVPFFGGRQVSKATVLIGLTDDLADHYGAMAVYMRLKGHLPPTAQGR